MSHKNTPQRIKTLSLSLIATSLFAMSNTSIAQEQIEEIIVTGEKIERSIQDTVSSVAVFTEDQIEESAIYDIQDVFDRLANVNSAQGNEGFTIRGINDNLVSGAGTSSLASYHQDGAFIGRRGVQAGQKQLWDIGQVEIFRGPQSTNQGRNSLAGAIFVRSNDPTYESEGQYRIAFGNDNTSALSLAYGGTLIEDQLAFRVSIDDQSTDGFITNELLDDDEYGDSSNTTVRGKLLFEPEAIPGLSVLTTLSFSENEAGDVFSSLIDEQGNEIDPFENRAFANIEAFENVDQTIASTEINYEINDQWSLTSITSYNDTEFFRQDDDDRQATGGLATRAREENVETFSQEFRLNFDSDRLRGNAGLYYFDQDGVEEIDDLIVVENIQATIITNASAFGATADQAALLSSFYEDTQSVDRTGSDSQDIENYAIFANIEYDVNDLITVFAGFRYDNEEVNNVESTTNTSTSILPTAEGVFESLIADNVATTAAGIAASMGIPVDLLPAPVITGITNGVTANLAPLEPLITNGVNAVNATINNTQNLDNDADFSAFLPKAGITFNWNDNLNTSFSVQRAYRAGGSGSVINIGAPATNFEFDPEFTTNYDLALRSQWFDNRLTVNANIFYVDWEDQQVSIINATGDGIVTNAGESEVKGVELELGFRPTDNLDLYASFGYVDTEFTDFPADEVDELQDDLTGNSFNNAPERTASAGFSYDVTSKLRLQSDINYQDESFDDTENLSENDSRVITNAKVTYQINDALEIAVVGRNIFDREYIITNDRTEENAFNPNSRFEDGAVVVGQPRTVLLQLQGNF